MKYIAYARKSTDEKDKQVLSIDNQISELKEFALRENLEIVDFLTEAQSAKVTGRPVFNSLVKRIEKGEAQGIVSWNPDRIARNSIDGGKIIYLLDTGELQSLKFPTHWFENTPQGRFMLSIAFGQAKYYVDNLSQNVHRGLKYKIKMGVWPALAPWGYKNDRNLKTVVLDPVKANVIKKAFELYATGKYTLHDMCMYFYENGIRERKSGDPPETGTVRDVFKRPFYYGYMLYNGELYKGTHTPIITKDTFDKVQEIIKQRGWFHSKLYRKKTYDFAFTGLLKCHYCKYSITAEQRPFFFPRTNNKIIYIYYHCTKKDKKCFQKGYTREEILEVQFREMISSLSVSEAWVDQMNKFLVQDIESQKSVDKISSSRLETEISQTEQKLDTLLEAYLDTVIDSESYVKKKNELMERKANLVSKQKELTSDNPNWIEGVQNYITCAQKCAKIARAENNCHDLADMAKKVGSKYFLKDKKIEFCLYFPYNLLAANGGAASFPAQFVPTLAFSQSKYYIDNLSENVKRGMKHKVRIGVWPVQAPLGYLNDKLTKTIIVDPVRHKIIKKCFEMFATGKHSFTSISDYLFSVGVKSRSDKKTKVDTIKRMLCSRFYLGILNYKGELHKGIHKPIISKTLFDLTQKQISRFERPRYNGHDFPFIGLARCGECGGAITAESHSRKYKNGNSPTFIYYRCTKKFGKCSQKYISQNNLAKQLRKSVRSVVIPDQWKEKWLKLLEKDKEQESVKAKENTALTETELQTTEIKLSKLLDTYLDGVVNEEDYKKKKNELFNTKLNLQEQIEKIKQQGSSWLEPLEHFIMSAFQAQKIAQEKNEYQNLSDFVRSACSNFFLTDQHLQFSYNLGYSTLFSVCGSPHPATYLSEKSFSVSHEGLEPSTITLRGYRSTIELVALIINTSVLYIIWSK